MDRIRDEQHRRNRLVRGCWELYAPHRRRVTDLILGLRAPDASPIGEDRLTPRLCVLGAGNCNDLDLPQLLAGFHEVHLVDLDGEALAEGVSAQQLAAERRVCLHGGVDVTGVIDRLSACSADRSSSVSGVDAVLAAVAAHDQLPLGGTYDVVASVCLLSQLLEAVKLALGETYSRYLPLVQAIRAQHLRQAVGLCCPGGRLALVTDFVSSDTCPELATVDEAQLPALAEQLVRSHNFFTGLNPFLLRGLFVSDPWLAARVEQLRLSPPWRWQFPTRVYAVCAVTARRSSRLV